MRQDLRVRDIERMREGAIERGGEKEGSEIESLRQGFWVGKIEG